MGAELVQQIASLENRFTAFEQRFATFMEGMAEFKGELKADMKESQRQRAGLFTRVENLSQQLTELDVKFIAHAEEGHDWRERTDERLGAIENEVEDLEDKSPAMMCRHSCPTPPQDKADDSDGTERKKAPWFVSIAAGGGLLSVIFGDNVTEGIKAAVQGLRGLFSH